MSYVLQFKKNNKTINKRFGTIAKVTSFLKEKLFYKKINAKLLNEIAYGSGLGSGFVLVDLDYDKYKNKVAKALVSKAKKINRKKKVLSRGKKRIKPDKTWINSFYENQTKAAQDLYEAMRKYNHIVFRAFTQSGKTGTLKYLLEYKAAHLFDKHKYAVYITGLSDKVFKTQNAEILTKSVESESGQILDSCIDFVNIQLHDKFLIEEQISSYDVVIIDESDIGSAEDSILGKLIQRGVLDNKTVIVVSATNYEMDSIEKTKRYSWYKVCMDINLLSKCGYKGLSFFKESGWILDHCGNSPIEKIEQTKDKYELSKQFKEGLEWWLNDSEGSHAIVRISSSCANAGILFNIIEANYGDLINQLKCYGVEIKDNLSRIKSDKFDNVGKNLTIVVQTLKAGHDLGLNIKEETTFLWDTIKSSSAAVQQSLLGRMCGFGKYDKPKRFYVNVNALDSMVMDNIPTNGRGGKVISSSFSDMPGSVSVFVSKSTDEEKSFQDFKKYMVTKHPNIPVEDYWLTKAPHQTIHQQTKDKIKGRKNHHRVSWMFMKYDQTTKGLLTKAKAARIAKERGVFDLTFFTKRNSDDLRKPSVCILVCDFVDTHFFNSKESKKLIQNYPDLDSFQKREYIIMVPDESLTDSLKTYAIPKIDSAFSILSNEGIENEEA